MAGVHFLRTHLHRARHFRKRNSPMFEDYRKNPAFSPFFILQFFGFFGPVAAMFFEHGAGFSVTQKLSVFWQFQEKHKFDDFPEPPIDFETARFIIWRNRQSV